MTSSIIVLILRLLVAFTLYGFVGWAFYTVWQDLKQQSHVLAIQKIPTLTFKIHGEEETSTQTYMTPDLVIGRDPACDLILQDETVSAHHTHLSYHHHQWWIEDMDSTNGTYLNQERLTTPTVMITGDELRCGHVELSVMVGDKEPEE
jgi:pSer/pThr/pTyr-binding forkhead associated (FHA) protein